MSVIKLSDIDATIVIDYHAALVRIRTLESELTLLYQHADWQSKQIHKLEGEKPS